MVADKRQTGERPRVAEPGVQTPAPAQADATKRKSWIKKSPVEIILEQVTKQEEKVAVLRKELTKEEGELKKMQDATKLLQAK